MTETANEFVARQRRKWEEDREGGKLIPTKDVARRGRLYWRRKAWTFRPQSNYREGVHRRALVLVDEEGQRAHPDEAQTGDTEYRIGYWTVVQSEPRAGLFGWGNCPMIPAADLEPLLEQVRGERTIR